VPEHEIQWGPNPHRRVCGDTSQLLEIVPGHHHFKASYLATVLCNLVKTDLRSQFYKAPPTRESSPTSEPPWSLGNEKTMRSQKFFASRRQAWVIGDNGKIATNSPRVQISPSGLNQNQGRPDTNDDSHGGARAQEPIHKETEAIPHENNLFYRNGNPKPPSTARPLPRGPTKNTRKHLGGRKRNRRRNRRSRPSDEASKEPEIDGQVTPQIDQITFTTMACDELEKLKKITHKSLIARPTPPTPVTKPQSSPSLAGDDT